MSVSWWMSIDVETHCIKCGEKFEGNYQESPNKDMWRENEIQEMLTNEGWEEKTVNHWMCSDCCNPDLA